MATFSWTSLFTNQTLTRDSFITNLRTRVDEDTEDNISDTQIVSLINQGLDNIGRAAGLLPEYATVSADGSSSYTLPTNLVMLDELYYIDTNSPANYTYLSSTNFQELQSNGYSSDTPYYYVREGENVSIFGSGKSTGTYRLYGSRIPTKPATGSSYIDLPDQYIELLYLWCEWKYWVRRRVPDESSLARELYFSILNSVREQVVSQYSRGATAYG